MSGKVKETKAVWGRWSVACHSAAPAGFKGMPGTAKHAGRWSNPPSPPTGRWTRTQSWHGKHALGLLSVSRSRQLIYSTQGAGLPPKAEVLQVQDEEPRKVLYWEMLCQARWGVSVRPLRMAGTRYTPEEECTQKESPEYGKQNSTGPL